MNLKDYIREVPDFPKKGILFYDISTLLQNPKAWQYAIDSICEKISDYKIDSLVGVESRGFLLAAPLSIKMNLPFSMIRKKGKLPGQVISYDYQLEYGTDSLEIQDIAIKNTGERVALLDDLLATGGTMAASIHLLEKVGARVEACACIIELEGLNGRKLFSDTPLISLAKYNG